MSQRNGLHAWIGNDCHREMVYMHGLVMNVREMVYMHESVMNVTEKWFTCMNR